MIPQKYWMVHCPEGQLPKAVHTSLDSATKEAERLANIYHGQRFVVLEAVRFCKVNCPIAHWESIPWRDARD